MHTKEVVEWPVCRSPELAMAGSRPHKNFILLSVFVRLTLTCHQYNNINYIIINIVPRMCPGYSTHSTTKLQIYIIYIYILGIIIMNDIITTVSEELQRENNCNIILLEGRTENMTANCCTLHHTSYCWLAS